MRLLLFHFFQRLNYTVKGPLLKTWGRSLIASGIKTMGGPYYMEQRKKPSNPVNPSMRGVTENGKTPELTTTYFIAPNATIIGDVYFGEQVPK